MSDLEDLIEDCDEIIPFDKELITSKIHDFNSEKLCEMIVCNNYFNMYSDITISCMKELAIRRQNGENFDFESYINKCKSELPELNIDLKNVSSLISRMSISK